jgi:beta-galactosidase
MCRNEDAAGVTDEKISLARRHLLNAAAVGGAALTLADGSNALAKGIGLDGATSPARDLPFDSDWRFFLGDAPGAAQAEFDDSGWRRLDLPHDWSIEDRPGAPKEAESWVPPVALWNPVGHPKDAKPMSQEVPIVMASVPPPSPDGPPRKVGPFDVDATAFGWGTGWTVGGTSWYRKYFSLTDRAPDEQVEIRFDGAFLITDVWLNGVALGRNINGYLGFAFDLTPYLRADGANVLAVRVANEGETARWYSGSGIYRHAWLSRTGAVRIPFSGTAITTLSASEAHARIAVGAEVENRAQQSKIVQYRVAIRNGSGGAVTSAAGSLSLAPGQAGRIDAELDVDRPALWSPDAPNLHFAEITLTSDGTVSDQMIQRFGIRTLSVSPKTGFQVNGKTYRLRGACLHHDNGILGAVAIDRAERRKVELVKANGFNAIRCSHNPQSPHFLDACDELGMIVIDEAFDVWEKPKLLKDAYQVYFEDNWRKDLAAMVRRDRNRPSVAFWSIGNEIAEAVSPRGVELAGYMRTVILEHDKSRFITQALTASFAGKVGEGARAQLDVTSYNYSFNAVDKDHITYPELSFLTTETHSGDAYDIREHMDKNPAYMGEFVWTGLDYIGEVGSGSSRLRSDTGQPDGEKKIIFGMDVSMLNFYVWDYPAYQSGCGDLDILGQKKPPSFYRDVVWGRAKLALFVQRPTPPGFHEDQTAWGWPDILESWTWPEAGAAAMTVWAYASGDEIALLLNGNEVERKRMTPGDKLKARFKLPYQPGSLTAVSYTDGKEIARKTLTTVDAPAKLRLRAERKIIDGSPSDLAYVFAEVCDARGRLVPDAAVPLIFSADGPLRLLAAGSANPYGVESFQDARTRSFHGCALGIFRPTSRRGEATVRVASPGLMGADQSIIWK